MNLWEFLQQNWGWFAGAIAITAAWFRDKIVGWWLNEASADRAANRRLREQQVGLDRKQLDDQMSTQNRLFETLEKVNVVLTQLNLTIPTLLPAITSLVQESDKFTHTMLRDIAADVRDLSEDVAGMYAREGRERPSRIRKRAAGSIPPGPVPPAPVSDA
jgi:hypothetical protein